MNIKRKSNLVLHSDDISLKEIDFLLAVLSGVIVECLLLSPKHSQLTRALQTNFFDAGAAAALAGAGAAEV